MVTSESRPRIVLDTNVWVSGLLSPRGAPADLLRAFQQKRIQFVVSDLTVDEIIRVLNYPKIRKYPHMTDDLLRSVAALLLHEAERIEPSVTLSLSPDPDDNMFLEVAVAASADALVTGDKSDLLSLHEVHGIPILTARACVHRWNLAVGT